MAAGTITGSLKGPIATPTCCTAPKTKSAMFKAISDPSAILIPPPLATTCGAALFGEVLGPKDLSYLDGVTFGRRAALRPFHHFFLGWACTSQ